MTIEKSSSVLSTPLELDIDVYRSELLRVESILIPLIELSRIQTKEIDDFLILYESSVSLINIISIFRLYIFMQE